MSYENLNGLSPFTLPAASTSIGAFEAVTMSGGNVDHPTDGAAILGVTRSVDDSTSNPLAAIYPPGSIAKLKFAASTVSAGDQFAVSTAGLGTAVAAGEYSQGFVVAGSSGGANRVLSVLLSPIGTT